MTRALRVLAAAATLGLLLGIDAGAANAARSVQPGAGCGSTSSAINQYCENIPSAAGGSPGAGGPTVGTALPPGAATAYGRLPVSARKRARKLLGLAAPAPAVPLSGPTSHQGSWSPPLALVLAMVAVAAAAVGVALARRHRRTESPAG